MDELIKCWCLDCDAVFASEQEAVDHSLKMLEQDTRPEGSREGHGWRLEKFTPRS